MPFYTKSLSVLYAFCCFFTFNQLIYLAVTLFSLSHNMRLKGAKGGQANVFRK